MKRLLLTSVLVFLGLCPIFAQTKSHIILKFTAQSHGLGIPSDSIYVKNLTQGNEKWLYSPDTTLILNIVTGIKIHYYDYEVEMSLPDKKWIYH